MNSCRKICWRSDRIRQSKTLDRKIAGNARLFLLLFAGVVIIAAAVLFTVSSGNSGTQDDPNIGDERERAPGSVPVESATTFDEETALIGVEPNETHETEDTAASVVTIKMRFLDSSRNPLAGVSVEAKIRRSSHTTESGSSGAAEIAIPVLKQSEPDFLSVKATLPWHVPYRKSMRIISGDQVELGEIVLESAGAVSGRVLDRTGLPIKDIAVFCTGSEIDSLNMEEVSREGIRFSEDWILCGNTGSDGTFRASAVKVGSRRFWSGGTGYLYFYSDPVEVAAGVETHGVEIVLDARPREQLIECLVLYPDGKPVPKAWVRIKARTGGHGSNTDSQGRYRRLLKREGPYTLEATDPAGRYESVRLEDVQPGAPNLVLQFRVPLRKLRLLVSSSGPEPPGDFTAMAWNRSFQSIISSSTGMRHLGGFGRNREYIEQAFSENDRAEDGTVSMGIPDGEFFVTVSARGFAEVELGPFFPTAPPDPVKAVLDPIPGLSGRVVCEDGVMEGVRISLHEQISPDRSFHVSGFDCRSAKDAKDSDVTGTDGSFRLCPGVSGTWFLRAGAEGYAPAELGPLAVDCRTGQDGLELRLTTGGSIAGRVIMEPGQDPAGTIVAASRGDGFPCAVLADESGAFRLERLTPGPWLVEKRREEDLGRTGSASSGSEKVPPNWSCIVEEGKTTRYDLNLSHETVCLLKGRINTEGVISSHWSAFIEPADNDIRSQRRGLSGGSDARARLSVDGSFTIKVMEIGTYNLTIWGRYEKKLSLWIKDTVELTGGETTWVWNIPFTKVEVRPPPSGLEGSGRLTCRWEGEGARKASISFRLETSDPVLLPAVPVGTIRIEQRGRQVGSGPQVLAEAETKAGETTVVNLE